MKNLDLNLLPQLQVLLELKNVSRAAERLQLSQPATSASTHSGAWSGNASRSLERSRRHVSRGAGVTTVYALMT